MWRMATSELSKRTVYRGQKLLFMGTIKATIKHIYINGQSVQSGYFSPTTKPIFRSESARYVLFIQMSKEMWDFDTEGAGEIMFNKVVSGFLPDLFKRWLRINARHLVTIILFTRMRYDGDAYGDHPDDKTHQPDPDSNPGEFRDYYRVVVSDMASGDWINILYSLKKEFKTFLREVSIVPKSRKGTGILEDLEAEHSSPGTVIAGKPSSASQGNILEAINLAAAQFAKDYIDRDLIRTGISVIVVTPGTGVFEVDYNMLKLTTDTLMGSGIGIDLVCLSPMPLHSVPLFKYRTPRLVSSRAPPFSKGDDEGHAAPVDNMGQDEKTPRQRVPNFGHADRSNATSTIPTAQTNTDILLAESSEDWRYAMPYWVDVSFWAGTSDDMLELTKPRKADKVVKRSHKRGRIFALRCRLYELQMMGVLENELGDISIPYMEEDPLYPRHMQHITAQRSMDKPRRASILSTIATAPGSYSSRGDRDYTDDQLDENRIAQKAWMEAYDDAVFSSLEETRSGSKQTEQSSLRFSESPELSRGSHLSASFRSIGSSFGKTARPPPDANFHQLIRERSREVERPSLRGAHHVVDGQNQDIPHADDTQRQRVPGRQSHGADHRPSYHQRDGSGNSLDQQKSTRLTPSDSPAPSNKNSSSRSGVLPSPAKAPTSGSGKAEPSNRPSNWFLRQISIGGKAAAAKPTIADATIDITQGRVKPAMLTVENNQKGAIAERLASTRQTITEKVSKPIAIRTVSRAGLSTSDSPSSDQGGRSVETVRRLQSTRSNLTSTSSSVVKDPGSTFLLAGSRALGDPLPPKPALSSSGGARDLPRTLSPTSAIAPWAVLVNPCNPWKNSINPRNQFRRWHHVFPRTVKTGTVKWRSLCSPAAVPLTHEWFPTAEQIATEYNENPYKIIQNEDDEMTEHPKSRESLVRELVAFRLSHGFQIIVGASVAEFSGRQQKSLSSILAPEYMSSDGDTVFMSVGNSIHQLVCVAGGEVEVKRYNRKPTTALESSAGIDTPFPYRAYIRTAFEVKYDPRDVILRPPRREYNWNLIDTFLAGYHDEFSDVLRFWRARFVLIPVDIPLINRRPLHMVSEDSEEEIRLEGIRKLTQLWQRNRDLPPEERHLHAATSKKQRDPNPLAIEYHTRDPSAIVAAGPEVALFSEVDSEFQTSIFSDSEKYQKSTFNIDKLKEDLQGENGIPMMDRRWHWKTHKNCFLGFDLVNWLLANFQDVDSRDEAVDLGNQLMNQDVFAHVQGRHLFRDGNFFFRLKDDSEARAEPRNWFGMRMSDKSVPSTPLGEAPRTSPFTIKNNKSRPNTSGSSIASSASGLEGETTPTRSKSSKRKVTLSRVLRYDVDSRKRSYRPEIISLHYDRLHNPDNCYHIRIDWMNVTAKLIEDAIVTWATSVEKYGLKLVEVPISEVSNIIEHHPFRSPYTVKLALQPPRNVPEPVWDSSHVPIQYPKADKLAYHKALLRKLNFVLDMEAASAFPADVEVKYSWGVPDYKYNQFIHRSGTLLAQIADEGNFLLLANRLAHNRAKDNSRIRPTDPYEHKKAIMDGGQSIRLPSTPAERANPHRSPFASPVVRPVQDSSMLHTALHDRPVSMATPHAASTTQTPEQIKDEVEAFCSDAIQLAIFYNEAFKQAPSPSPRIMPVLDDRIPNLGLPPAISIREASPANTGWTLSSALGGRGGTGERGSGGGVSEPFGSLSGIAGRRQGSEGSMSTLGRRKSVVDATAGNAPRRQDSQGSLMKEK
jgi:hypothetical protein